MSEDCSKQGEVRDIVIIGGGPAGLTAGLYVARARMDAVLLQSFSVMGQATMTDRIENYPGVELATGFEITQTFKNQATKFGLCIDNNTVEKVSSELDKQNRLWKVEGGGKKYIARSVIVASGAQPKKLNVPGEKTFLTRGVSYCGTCDGAFFRDRDIVVVGGGNSAVEEALYLTRFGKTVTIVHRRDRLRATKVLQERALEHEKIHFKWKSEVREIKGESKVEGILLEDVTTGATEVFACDGIFIFVGWEPNTGFLPEEVKKERSAILVDKDMRTSEAGLFAAGDCCKKDFRQIVTACGDGANAAHQAQLYVERMKGTAYE